MNRPYEGFMLPKQENLPLARQMAVEGLLKSDPAERAARGGGRFEPGADSKSRIGVRYLGREVWLSLPGGTMETPDGGGPLSLREEILILHYLERASGSPPDGKLDLLCRDPRGSFLSSGLPAAFQSPPGEIFRGRSAKTPGSGVRRGPGRAMGHGRYGGQNSGFSPGGPGPGPLEGRCGISPGRKCSLRFICHRLSAGGRHRHPGGDGRLETDQKEKY